MEKFGDHDSAAILQIIYDEEISHVAAGNRWFTYLCEKTDQNALEQFHAMVKTYFKGELKPPFNVEARSLAGIEEQFYNSSKN